MKTKTKARNLTRYEQETIITFNQAENIASVFTYNKKWQRKLEEIGCKPTLVNDFGGKGYKVNKRCIPTPHKLRGKHSGTEDKG